MKIFRLLITFTMLGFLLASCEKDAVPEIDSFDSTLAISWDDDIDPPSGVVRQF